MTKLRSIPIPERLHRIQSNIDKLLSQLHLLSDYVISLQNDLDKDLDDSSDDEYEPVATTPEPEHGVIPYYRKSVHAYEIEGKNITIFNLPPAQPLSREETGQPLLPVIDLDAPSRTPSPVGVGSYEPHPKPRGPE